jgi:hypothetical protein
MTINRKFFFDHIREPLFPDGLQQHQVDGIEAILGEWEPAHAADDDRWLAYILATAYHESAHTMQPVRETLASSDAQAVARLDSAWHSGKLSWVSTPYWQPDPSGKSWFGRGLVQITFQKNYAKLGKAIGEPKLGTDPDLALDMGVAIKVMFVGMYQGLFTGRKLSDYFNKAEEDWIEARRIVNGLDRAKPIAGYAKTFYAAISYTTG